MRRRYGLIYCSGGLSGKYNVLAVCQIVHCASGLSCLTAVCLIRQRFVSSGPERPRVYSDLSQEEKERYNADIQVTNILLQGLPKDIYTLVNHYTDAKDIWDNVKMLLEGSELTKEDRESQLYDDFEHFRQNKGETIHDYYVWFAKLINDTRNIKMTIGLRDSNYDQLYAYLKQHEAHANENKIMLDRFTQHTVDPLALMSNVSHQQPHSKKLHSAQATTEFRILQRQDVADISSGEWGGIG
nr:hypothetical protein [Tanacetum cinerariifolium]